jgi:thiol peroxidase
VATIKLKGNSINTRGDLPAAGTDAPGFSLTRNDLSKATLADFDGKKKVLNIFPSLDTPVCAASVRRFNIDAAKLEDTVVLNISCDLPFAQKRHCASEGIDDAITLSAFRSGFPDDYNVRITDGPLAELCSRAVVILDDSNKVIYTEQAPEITEEPDYEAALAALATLG